MSKVQLKFYTQYLPVINTFRIYKDITEQFVEGVENTSTLRQIECVLSVENKFDDMTHKEFISSIINKFKEGLSDSISNDPIFRESIFITFSKFPDMTPEYYLNNLSYLLNDQGEA